MTKKLKTVKKNLINVCDDCILYISEYLPTKDVVNTFNLVCKEFYRIFKHYKKTLFKRGCECYQDLLKNLEKYKKECDSFLKEYKMLKSFGEDKFMKWIKVSSVSELEKWKKIHFKYLKDVLKDGEINKENYEDDIKLFWENVQQYGLRRFSSPYEIKYVCRGCVEKCPSCNLWSMMIVHSYRIKCGICSKLLCENCLLLDQCEDLDGMEDCENFLCDNCVEKGECCNECKKNKIRQGIYKIS